jgi:hypothetical protein
MEIKNIIKGIENISRGRQFIGALDDLKITIEVLNAKSIYKEVPYAEIKTARNTMDLQQYRYKYDYMNEDKINY